MDRVTVAWNGKRRFVAWDEAGHGVVMDAPGEHGGDGSGVRPLEAVLYALGGCTGIDVVAILQKQRQEVRSLTVTVNAEQREERPKRYDRIHVVYEVGGKDIKRSAVERAVSLSEEKYCSVRAMFDPSIQLTSEIRIVDME
ncbi:MAG: OsmC family protein [Coriobacteriia bacterium]